MKTLHLSHGGLSAAAAACGLSAAVILPGGPPGVGVMLVAVLVGATVATARPTEVSLHTIVSVVLAFALVAMATIRAAGWVVAVNLLAAGGLASLAVAGGRSWDEVVRGAGAAAAALARGLSFVLVPVRTAARTALKGRSGPALRGLGLGAALLVVFGALFASADRAFLQLAGNVLSPDVKAPLLAARIYLLVFVTALTGAYVVIGPRYAAQRAGSGDDNSFAQPARRLAFSEWTISLGLLNALFAAFVAVQMTVLFGGRHHVLDTVGLSYAQYARQGFFQLVAVAALTLAVVGAAVRWAHAATSLHRGILRALLGSLCMLTLVVLASALRRLTLYEDMYGLTRLRISVHAVILWLGVLFAMVIVAGILWRWAWLPRAFVYASAAGLLAFSIVNPDGLIARQNVERFEETGYIDVSYLQGLSPDAVPALSGLRSDIRVCVYQAIGEHLSEDEPWSSFNLSRRRAVDVIAGAGSSDTGGCGTAQGSWETAGRVS